MRASFKIDPAEFLFLFLFTLIQFSFELTKKNCCLIFSGSQKKQQQQKQSRIMTILKKNSFPFFVFLVFTIYEMTASLNAKISAMLF